MIKVNDLSYRYPGANEAVIKAISFKIQPGEIFGFLGPSGAGKSTTQKILYRTISDFEGNVDIDGTSIRSLGRNYLAKIGVGFELPNHYLKLTGRENLNLFASFYPKNSIKDLDELFLLFGLNEWADKRVEDYSKGMRMRLNFIRAVMHDPDILFFDEPTSGLDPINAQKIKRYIKKLKTEGKTIFVTTHDMTTADELCDRVSFLVNGEIKLTGEPKQLKRAYGKDTVRVELAAQQNAEFPLTGLGSNSEFLNFITTGEVVRIHTSEATLEEVFLKVTGSVLADE